MFLRFNLKSQREISLTEIETKIFLKKLNYLKLLKLLNSKQTSFEGEVKVNETIVDAKDINSIEIVL